ncbi:MAG: hypothetical protein KatS3mg057_1234 [Herpetosiphonaceae bacterium]|nr:MAG: hypothetical protein KatS3mg057_1234 [Herpetosiphonaceae bacterium]
MTLRAYLRLLNIFYKNTLMSELEYRTSFTANVLTSLFWLVWAALSVRVFFFQTETIAGWTYNELLVVVGLFFTMNGLRQLFLQPNLSRLSEYVQMGTLDYILTKPINSQFLVSLRYIGVENCGDPLLGLALLGLALWRMGYTPGVIDVLLFLTLVASALVILYSFNLMIQTTTFWLINIRRADSLVWSLLEAGRFPVQFYTGWVRLALTVIVPVAFMTTFPAQALLGRLPAWIAAVALLMAGVLFLLASAFWRVGLRSYSGASS